MPRNRYEDDVDAEFDFDRSQAVSVERGSPKSSLAVRFDARDLDRLRALAYDAGVGITQLVRTWVLERLEDEEQPEDTVVQLLGELTSQVSESAKLAQVIKRRLRATAGPIVAAPTSPRPARH
jgi:hypothetical protein